MQRTLSDYLNLDYPYRVWFPSEHEAGYVIAFDDLPGCMTQCNTKEEIPFMASDARELWLTVEYEADPYNVPLPYSYCKGEYDVR